VAGFEGDVAPRAENGNGGVTVADWAQVGRFAVELDTPSVGSEFQRADCAPRASLGDGKIDLADWVQTDGMRRVGCASCRRWAEWAFVCALDAPVLTNALAEPEQNRGVRVVPATLNRGQDGTVIIELTALGNEFAAGFMLNFDVTQLTFVRAVRGRRCAGGDPQRQQQ
jgi:hypothetical protein